MHIRMGAALNLLGQVAAISRAARIIFLILLSASGAYGARGEEMLGKTFNFVCPLTPGQNRCGLNRRQLTCPA